MRISADKAKWQGCNLFAEKLQPKLLKSCSGNNSVYAAVFSRNKAIFRLYKQAVFFYVCLQKLNTGQTRAKEAFMNNLSIFRSQLTETQHFVNCKLQAS